MHHFSKNQSKQAAVIGVKPISQSHDNCNGNNHNHAHDHTHAAQPESFVLANLSGSKAVEGGVLTSIRIMQMDCPTEEILISKKLTAMPIVKSMEFNLIQRVLNVVHEPNALDSILDAIRSLGFEPEVADENGDLADIIEKKKHWWPLALAVVSGIFSEVAEWINMPEWTVIALAVIAIMSCGLTTYKKGWIALRNGNLNINALMSIAVTGAFIIGQWPEAAMVMVLFTIAELIEAKSLDRARNAITGLMSLAPEKAVVQQNDLSWKEIDAKIVMIGSIIRIKPGERLALDGVMTKGSSSIDQAPITGESLPIDKTEGDLVFAGTINQSGSFEYQVTAVANGSTLARIIKAIEGAQGARAPTQRFVDQFSRIYTPIVFGIALIVAIAPPLFLSGSWYEWIYKALVMLVIACPCALVISTPVSIVSGLAAAARKGILIKGGVYLEEGRKLNWLALDKTGTITHGKPKQTDFQALSHNALSQDDVNLIHQLAFSLANRSDHPVSKAIANAPECENMQPLLVDDFQAILGRGVSGHIDEKLYYLGNHRLIEELGLGSDALKMQIDSLEQQGKTVIMLTSQAQVLALFAVADTVKESSREAIIALHQLGIKTIMLTGDNEHTAQAIASQVGIDAARGNLLPEDKLSEIIALCDKGVVGMVGDGINDAPALARANIGFAMGAMGTDAAIETADVALMNDDLRKIPEFIHLSKRTHTILVQNITLALSIKVVFLALTLMGLGTMWMAVFADVGASLIVVANGLRLLRA